MNTTEVKTDIEYARGIAHGEGLPEEYRGFPFFSFTNENLRGYMPNLPISGKDVLTVAASGYHQLNLALLGAKSITTYDINKIAYYWQELKKACVTTLTFDEFMNLYFIIGVKEFERKYEQIRSVLGDDTKLFWDAAYDDKKTSKYFLNGYAECGYDPNYVKANMYLDPNGFSEIKKKLCHVDFDYVHSNLLDLPSKLPNRQFDAIFTSNICSWVDEDKYRYFVENDVKSMLKPNGFAQVAYHYCGASKWLPFNDPQYETRSFSDLFNPEDGKNSISILHNTPIEETK